MWRFAKTLLKQRGNTTKTRQMIKIVYATWKAHGPWLLSRPILMAAITVRILPFPILYRLLRWRNRKAINVMYLYWTCLEAWAIISLRARWVISSSNSVVDCKFINWDGILFAKTLGRKILTVKCINILYAYPWRVADWVRLDADILSLLICAGWHYWNGLYFTTRECYSRYDNVCIVSYEEEENHKIGSI